MTFADLVDWTVIVAMSLTIAVIMWIRAPERHDLHTLRKNERIRKQLRKGK